MTGNSLTVLRHAAERSPHFSATLLHDEGCESAEPASVDVNADGSECYVLGQCNTKEVEAMMVQMVL